MTPVYLFNSYETAPRRRVFEIMRGTLPRLRSGAAFSDFWAALCGLLAVLIRKNVTARNSSPVSS